MHDQWTGADLDSLLGRRSLTRRQVLVTSLATGFALAVGPWAQTITTDTAGLTAGEVTIPVADGEIPRIARSAAGWAACLAWFRQHGVG